MSPADGQARRRTVAFRCHDGRHGETMPHLAIARFSHEGNSFSPVPTDLAAVRSNERTLGAEEADAEAAAAHRGTATEIGVALESLAERPGWTATFLRLAGGDGDAEPGAHVTKSHIARLRGSPFRTLPPGPVQELASAVSRTESGRADDRLRPIPTTACAPAPAPRRSRRAGTPARKRRRSRPAPPSPRRRSAPARSAS